MDAAQCADQLQRLEEQWVLYGGTHRTCKDIYERFVHNTAGLSSNEEMVKFVTDLRLTTAELSNQLFKLGALQDDLVRQRMNRVMAVVSFMYVVADATLRAQERTNNLDPPGPSDDMRQAFYNFSTITDSTPDSRKPYQNLLVHLACQAQMKGYRRYGEHVYEPLQTGDGHNTHSWEQVCDIKTFVYKCCRQEFHYDNWVMLTDHPSNARNAIGYLTDCEDYRFPRLTRDRSAFSFTNGIYLAERDQFCPYGSAAAGAVPSGLCCSKHFPHPFPPASSDMPWGDIPTPTFDSVLAAQQFPSEVSRWLLVFMGRLLYDVGQRDNWYVLIRSADGLDLLCL